jgi:hypothetical protein
VSRSAELAERAYPKLIHNNKLPKRGHFAAWEWPKLFSEAVRAGYRSPPQLAERTWGPAEIIAGISVAPTVEWGGFRQKGLRRIARDLRWFWIANRRRRPLFSTGGNHETAGIWCCFGYLCYYRHLHSLHHAIYSQRVEEGQPPAVSNASPIYGVSIPSGYHDWRLISVKQQVVEASSGNCAPSWATILR